VVRLDLKTISLVQGFSEGNKSLVRELNIRPATPANEMEMRFVSGDLVLNATVGVYRC
jgi:hypothetical protein